MQPQSVADDSREGTEYLPVLRLWMLRALLRCNGVRSFVRENRFAGPQHRRLARLHR